MLLISKNVLDAKSYGYKEYWCDSDLRKWLNKDFFEAAFTNWERNKISITNIDDNVRTPDNIKQGEATQDKLFVLSTNEANKYFASDDLRECALTRSASEACGKEGDYYWWLRTPGTYTAAYGYGITYCSVVSYDGHIFGGGEGLSRYGVRPAMWIDLK